MDLEDTIKFNSLLLKKTRQKRGKRGKTMEFIINGVPGSNLSGETEKSRHLPWRFFIADCQFVIVDFR